jgi:Tol biopolymer transport system component
VDTSKQLWLANADGSGALKLADPVAAIWSVKWSPDGRYLAYNSNNAIWIVSIDGKGARKLLGVEQMPGTYDPRNAAIGVAAWSPDNQVLFVDYSPALRIPTSTYVIDSSGDSPRLLIANYGLYGVSPAGDRATFAFHVEDDYTTHLFVAALSH